MSEYTTLGGRVVCTQCNALSKRSRLRCRSPAIKGKTKCRIHGGLSTGPKTPAGRAAISAANTKHGRYKNWREKQSKERYYRGEIKRLMREAERFFILQQIDTLWREHLQAMDALRESVGLRGYGQKDPLIEYKNEGYDMFLEMMTNMRRNVIYSMFMFQPAGSPSEAKA